LALRSIIDQDVDPLIVRLRLRDHSPYCSAISQISWNGNSVGQF
jgi:hypothetical protein